MDCPKSFPDDMAVTMKCRQPTVKHVGGFFERITNQSIDKVSTIDDIDKAVARANHIEGKLAFAKPIHHFGLRNGDVFPHDDGSTAQKATINDLVDAALGTGR